MLRPIMGATLAGLLAASLMGAASQPAAGSEPPPGTDAGPPYEFTTELMGEHMTLVLRDMVSLVRTEHGYRYWSGNHQNHILITVVDGRLRFRDRLTASFKKIPQSCEKQKVRVGIAAMCRIPADISENRPLLVEVWPRLGDDFLDASTLPAAFSVTMLSDEGDDVAYFGAGRDFFNGHSGRDQVWGGAGNDWIRAGLDDDTVYGGPGNDDIVAMQGADTIYADDGEDRIWGSEGDDTIWGNAGADRIVCGTGDDLANADSADRVLADCESVSQG